MATLEYHGHSCFVIESTHGRVILDPFLKDNPRADVAPENVGQVDAILVSHGHADHFGDTLAIARQHRATVVAAYEIASWCESKGVAAHGMATGGAHDFPFGWVKLVPAAHGSLFEADPAFSTNPVGFLYRVEGKLVYHMGDTALTADVRLVGELNRVDLLLAPIGDNYTMGPDDALKAVEFIRPGLVVPMHFDTFDVIRQDAGEFQRRVEEAGHRCHVLAPGETLEF
ncbi:MAG: metal-dependent hydrolase [Gemmatimonadetes bacterium]|nr:metal-dependent hydrolase [Gemmatimonadota bacterium]